jgi:LPS-assembly lipoprotein
MRPEHVARRFLLLALALLLTACGFQLRGTGEAAVAWPAALARLQLGGPALSPEVERQLAPALRRAGAELVVAGGADAARLEILAYDEGEDLLALGVGSTARDFQLSARIDYTLQAGGDATVQSGSVSANRTVQSSADQVNAALAEARRVKRELRDEVIDALVRRLAARG